MGLARTRPSNKGNVFVSIEMCIRDSPAYPDESSTVLAWLAREDGALRRAEVTKDGTTVVTCRFTEFTYTYDDTNQETEG